MRLSTFNIIKGIILFIPFALSAQSVQLHWIDNKPTQAAGVSWGVPFEKGKVKKTQSFDLVNDNSKTVPVQTWPLAYWPDGSVKWLGCAAVVDADKTFNLHFVSKPAQQTGIFVSKSNGLIQVNTGVLTCEINTKGNVLIKNAIY